MSLTVRRENLPVRCEICHQTDLFDPETGNCMRCVSGTIGAPLLRQNEAAINETKPDVSIEYAKVRASMKKMAPLLFFFSFILSMGQMLLITNLTFKLYLTLFIILLLIPTVIIFFNKHRCPNCRFLFHLLQCSTCPRCGAILESQKSTNRQ
jgi:ssDNA-binding Zn-finger/Zn-ribbon topoisomerase 1